MSVLSNILSTFLQIAKDLKGLRTRVSELEKQKSILEGVDGKCLDERWGDYTDSEKMQVVINALCEIKNGSTK